MESLIDARDALHVIITPLSFSVLQRRRMSRPALLRFVYIEFTLVDV